MSRSSLIPGSDTSDFADFIILFRGFHILYTMQCLKIGSVIYAVEIRFKVRKNIVFVRYAYINSIHRQLKYFHALVLLQMLVSTVILDVIYCPDII